MSDSESVKEQPSAHQGSSQLNLLLRSFVHFTMAVALSIAALKVINAFDVATIWDDGYIFQRYAKNLLDGEGIRWNPGSQEPSYGLTSLLFVVPSVLTNLVSSGNPSLAALMSGTICGVLFLALMVRLLLRHTDGPRWSAVAALVLFAFTFARSDSALHFVSGMDTTFAMAFVALYLIAAKRFTQSPTTRSAIVLGVLGALSYSVRPELVTFGVGIPVGWAVLGGAPGRKRGIMVAGIALLLIGVQLLICQAYFKSAVPLPFYAKGLKIYGDNIWFVYRGAAGREFADFVAHYWPLFALILLDLARPRHWWRTTSSLDKATLAASALCLFYYLAFTLPVMAFSQRFYHPPLAALAFLAAQSLGRIAKIVPGEDRIHPDMGRVGACAAIAFLWFFLLPPLTEVGKNFADVSTHRKWRFDPVKHSKDKGPQGYWFNVDKMAQLPDDAVFATTEVGMLGALAPNKTIVDLAGLNERTLAQHPFDPEWMLNHYKPDLIYMPHPHYKRMTKELRAAPGFDNYEFFNKRQLKTRDFGLALRKNSKHYGAMRDIVGDVVPIRAPKRKSMQKAAPRK